MVMALTQGGGWVSEGGFRLEGRGLASLKADFTPTEMEGETGRRETGQAGGEIKDYGGQIRKEHEPNFNLP